MTNILLRDPEVMKAIRHPLVKWPILSLMRRSSPTPTHFSNHGKLLATEILNSNQSKPSDSNYAMH